MSAALRVRRDEERAALVLEGEVVLEGSPDVRVRAIHRSAAAFGVDVQEGGEGGLAVPRREDAAGAVEHRRMLGHEEPRQLSARGEGLSQVRRQDAHTRGAIANGARRGAGTECGGLMVASAMCRPNSLLRGRRIRRPGVGPQAACHSLHPEQGRMARCLRRSSPTKSPARSLAPHPIASRPPDDDTNRRVRQ